MTRIKVENTETTQKFIPKFQKKKKTRTIKTENHMLDFREFMKKFKEIRTWKEDAVCKIL